MLPNEAVAGHQINESAQILAVSDIESKLGLAHAVGLRESLVGLEIADLSRGSALDKRHLHSLAKVKYRADSKTPGGLALLKVEFSGDNDLDDYHTGLLGIVCMEVNGFFFVALEHATASHGSC